MYIQVVRRISLPLTTTASYTARKRTTLCADRSAGRPSGICIFSRHATWDDVSKPALSRKPNLSSGSLIRSDFYATWLQGVRQWRRVFLQDVIPMDNVLFFLGGKIKRSSSKRIGNIYRPSPGMGEPNMGVLSRVCKRSKITLLRSEHLPTLRMGGKIKLPSPGMGEARDGRDHQINKGPYACTGPFFIRMGTRR